MRTALPGKLFHDLRRGDSTEASCKYPMDGTTSPPGRARLDGVGRTTFEPCLPKQDQAAPCRGQAEQRIKQLNAEIGKDLRNRRVGSLVHHSAHNEASNEAREPLLLADQVAGHNPYERMRKQTGVLIWVSATIHAGIVAALADQMSRVNLQGDGRIAVL